MTRILMVCLGNICRSPVAEGILRHKAQLAGLDLEVDSAGTAGYHIGEPPDERMQLTARNHGIDISGLRGRKFAVADFTRFDLIYAMDEANFSDIISMAETEEDRENVTLLLNAYKPGADLSVPDPWYGGQDGFEHVFQLIEKACDNIVINLLK